MSLLPFPGAAAPKEPADESTSPYAVNSPPPAAASSPAPKEPDDDESVEGRMSFLEHLDELRRRITHAVVALFVGFLIAFAFINQLFAFVYLRLAADVPNGHLVYTEPGEAFFIYLKIAALAGLLIASPYVMWQVWLFIAPGLYANEKRLAIPFVFFASALFVSGAAFSHYILFPFAWKFFAGFSNDFLTFMPRVEPIFSLYVKLMLAMGIVFQLPMLMFVLARLGLVTARFLLRNFKYATLIIFIVAAIVTPDGSFIPQVVMAASMIGLYAVSIAVVWIFAKRQSDDGGNS